MAQGKIRSTTTGAGQARDLDARDAAAPAPRPRGRPARPEAEQRAAVMAATTWLLLNEGYAATTLEAVARRAGMAKKTVYRYASDREDLVAQVVRGWTDGFAPVMAQDVTSVDEVLPALARVLQAIAERVLSADAVGMFRLLTADFPGRDAAAGLPGERHRTRHGHVGRLVPAPGQARTHPGERAPRRGRPAAVHGDRRTAARHGAGADAAAARKLDR